MRDALSMVLAAGGQPLGVRDGDGQPIGTVTLELLGGLLGRTVSTRSPSEPDGAMSLPLAAAGPVIPSFGGSASSFACERANRLFCTAWFSRNWGSILWPALRQHVVLTLIAIAIGFVIATGLALLAYRRGWVERPVLIVTSILYTIPSLALFEVLQGVPGLGLSRTTAEVALVSYTLLIIFRNTLTGLREVPGEVRDAAAGMGMGRLRRCCGSSCRWRCRRSSPACGSPP